MKTLLDLASNLKVTRLDREFTQHDLAIKAKYSKCEVGYIEQAHTNPTLTTLCAISEALDTHPAFLLGNPAYQISSIKLGDYGIFCWDDAGLRFAKLTAEDIKRLTNFRGI